MRGRLKWAEGTAVKISGEDTKLINQHWLSDMLFCFLFFLNQVKAGLCLGWEKKMRRRVKSCAALLHDKQQPGASSDKALIQKIPPSFAENPNEDLKCSAGRGPGGRGYTLPLLAFPAIVSLSQHWPSWDGDERDMTARRGLRTQAPAPAWLRGAPDSTNRETQTSGMTSRRRRKSRTNRSCLQKTPETK